jgi:hypothetical protein
MLQVLVEYIKVAALSIATSTFDASASGMEYRMLKSAAYTLLLLIASSRAARADIGVPMIFVTLPYMIIALVPVILLETIVLARKLGVAPKFVVKTVSIANTVSTIIGIPITWFLLVVVEIVTGGGAAYGIDTFRQRFLAVTWQAPWLIPYDSELHWMIPAATLVLLAPFFFASWLIESKVAGRFLKEYPEGAVRRGMLAANGLSYLLLGLLDLAWLLAAQHHRL